MAKHHQKKEISEAIEFALDHGFTARPAGKSAHAAFFLILPGIESVRCIIAVHSTPRSAQNHADRIRREVERCLAIHPRQDLEEPERSP